MRVTPLELYLRHGDHERDLVALMNRNGTMWVDWTRIDSIAAPDDPNVIVCDSFELMVWILRRLRGVVPEVTREEAERIRIAGP